MADPWDPPADLSGGFFIAQYENGGIRHKQRIHILPFSTSTFAFTSPRGSEATVGDTIEAFFDIWEVYYTNAWTMVLLSLWQWQSGVLVSRIPPVVAPSTGSNGGSESLIPSGMNVWTMPTVGGHKFKLYQIAPADWAPTGVAIYTSLSAGQPGATMSYFSGADTMICAHDGTQCADYARVTTPDNARLRRHYGEN